MESRSINTDVFVFIDLFFTLECLAFTTLSLERQQDCILLPVQHLNANLKVVELLVQKHT